MMAHRLDRLFRPESVAVVGASPKGGYGLRTLRNLRGVGFAGRLYVVHPTRDEVDGVPAFASLSALPEVPDAVAAAIPAASVPDVVTEASAVGAGGMVVYAAGFAERGNAGAVLQQRISATGIPVIGPNCLGVASFRGRATLWGIELPLHHADHDGVVAVAAQSGNMALTTMLSGRLPSVAYGVSAGNQAVLDVADCLDYFLTDPGVRVVALIIEGLADVARFRTLALRAAERDVAVVVLKVGRSARGEAATVAHTGTLAGRDSAYDALFRQTGVYRVDDLDELIALCTLLSGRIRPRGGSLAVFASSGGECGLVADLAEDTGVALADLDDAAANPRDLGASAWGQFDAYEGAARSMGTHPDVDVVAWIGDAPTHAEPLDGNGWPEMVGGAAKAGQDLDVPVVLVTTTTDVVPDLLAMAAQHGMPVLAGIRPALRAIALAGTPRPRAVRTPPVDPERQARARELLGGPLTETVGKRLLARYGVRTPDGALSSTVDEAVATAERVGYPVVCKLEVAGLAHKSDIGGVELGLADQNAVRAAFERLARLGIEAFGSAEVRVERMAGAGVELIVGGRTDAAGTLVVLGAGGVLTELLDDATALLWPFDADDVRDALARLRVGRLLGGYRGGVRADYEAVAETVVRIGALLAELPEITELDVNPLLCGPDGCVALDALIVHNGRRG